MTPKTPKTKPHMANPENKSKTQTLRNFSAALRGSRELVTRVVDQVTIALTTFNPGYFIILLAKSPDPSSRGTQCVKLPSIPEQNHAKTPDSRKRLHLNRAV